METKTINKIDKHINCVIEDYKAIKNEISRRSELQRVALITYGGLIGLIFKFNKEPYFQSSQILLIWLASSIAYLFYISEDNFIRRLGKIANFNGWLFCHLLSRESKNDICSESLDIKYKTHEKTRKKSEYITLNDVVFPSESPFISKIIQAEESKEVHHELLNATFLGLYLIGFPIILTVYSYFHGKKCNNFTWDIWTIIAICFAVNISQHIYLQYKDINYLRWSLLTSLLLILTGLFFFAP